jgi:hypothetical protein
LKWRRGLPSVGTPQRRYAHCLPVAPRDNHFRMVFGRKGIQTEQLLCESDLVQWDLKLITVG